MSSPRRRDSARDVWGASPAGTAHARGAKPGTPQFFETVVQRRSASETSWLDEFVRFEKLEGVRVLEVGCGAGYDAYEFVRHRARYSGIDLTPENIDRTKSHLGQQGLAAEILLGDAESLPFDGDTFDVYFSNGVLHHVPSLRRSLEEARRVLVPGGRAIVTVYNRRSLFYVATLYGEHWLVRGDRHRYDDFADRLALIEYTTSSARPLVRAYTRGELRRMLEHVGFEGVEISVRKLNSEDLPALPGLRSIWPRIPESWLRQVGRALGWYLVAVATKPRA